MGYTLRRTTKMINTKAERGKKADEEDERYFA